MGALLVFPETPTQPEPAPVDELTAPQMMLLADITYRQLNYWTHAGYLKATTGPLGSGNPLRWKIGEVDRARRMRRLLAVGLTLACAHRVAEHPEGVDVELGDGVSIRLAPEPSTVDSPHGAAGGSDPESVPNVAGDEDPGEDAPRLDLDRPTDPQP